MLYDPSQKTRVEFRSGGITEEAMALLKAGHALSIDKDTGDYTDLGVIPLADIPAGDFGVPNRVVWDSMALPEEPLPVIRGYGGMMLDYSIYNHCEWNLPPVDENGKAIILPPGYEEPPAAVKSLTKPKPLSKGKVALLKAINGAI